MIDTVTPAEVRIEHIEKHATLYRVGRRGDGQGLWYDAKGVETGLINSLSDGPAKALPMGPHPVFRADGRKWVSVTESLSALARWFSLSDMFELASAGYRVEAIQVSRYRRLTFPTYAHEVYCGEDELGFDVLPHASPYTALIAELERAS